MNGTAVSRTLSFNLNLNTCMHAAFLKHIFSQVLSLCAIVDNGPHHKYPVQFSMVQYFNSIHYYKVRKQSKFYKQFENHPHFCIFSHLTLTPPLLLPIYHLRQSQIKLFALSLSFNILYTFLCNHLTTFFTSLPSC